METFNWLCFAFDHHAWWIKQQHKSWLFNITSDKKKHDLLKEKHDTTQNNHPKLVNFCQGFQRRNREKTNSRIEEIRSLPRVSDNKLANIAREKEAKNNTQKTIY